MLISRSVPSPERSKKERCPARSSRCTSALVRLMLVPQQHRLQPCFSQGFPRCDIETILSGPGRYGTRLRQHTSDHPEPDSVEKAGAVETRARRPRYYSDRSFSNVIVIEHHSSWSNADVCRKEIGVFGARISPEKDWNPSQTRIRRGPARGSRGTVVRREGLLDYTIIDNYYRREHFDFFRGFRSPFYGLTFTLDITDAKAYANDTGHSIYLILCYLVTRAAHQVEDFRYRLLDGDIVRYDRLDISATVPAPDGLFSFSFFDYHPKIEDFLEKARASSDVARERVTLEERQHFNQLLFTALPKVSFTHFNHPGRADLEDARPNTAFGRFTRDGDRLVAPVGLEVNHIFIDGNALGDFVERIQLEVASPND
jgi:chloramphenicol O-acetyltransferase type A